MPSGPAHPEPTPVAGIELAPGVHVAADAVEIQFARSSGPGGQNVNKVNTKVQLWVPLAALRGMSASAMQRLAQLAGSRVTQDGRLHIIAEESRSQERNREAAMTRLRELLVAALQTPRKRRRTRPTVASRRRRLDDKRHRSETKAQRRSPA